MFHARVDREKLYILLQTQPGNCRASSQQFTYPNGHGKRGRWDRRRNSNLEIAGNWAVSPTMEQWHSTWSCKCAQENGQSQSARQGCQELLRAHHHLLPVLSSCPANPGCSSTHWQSPPSKAGMGCVLGEALPAARECLLRHLC